MKQKKGETKEVLCENIPQWKANECENKKKECNKKKWWKFDYNIVIVWIFIVDKSTTLSDKNLFPLKEYVCYFVCENKYFSLVLYIF